MVAPETGVALLAVVVALAAVVALGAARRSWAVPAAIVLATLMAAQWIAADTGVLAVWDRRPPPLMLFVVAMSALTIVTALRTGPDILAAVPLWAVIGLQGFRLPLELFMHRAAELGAMPTVMSYSGMNFDIVTGASAIVVALLVATGHAPRWLIRFWNLLGSLLLVTIVTIAILATPLFNAFGSDQVNTWVAHAPVVWLPGVLVQAALFGHIVLWQAIARRDL